MSDNPIPGCAAADPAPRAPRLSPPQDTCDCHYHTFGPAVDYPYAEGRHYTPPDASKQDYTHLQKTLGMSRAVVVQPSVYGFDNRVTLEAIKAGGANFRGIAVIDPDTISDAELREMDEIGVRGVRVNQAYDDHLDVDYLRKVVTKIQPLGWHIQLFVDINKFPNFKQELADLPVDLVIDHMGFVATDKGISNPRFQDLLAMLRDHKCWVKVSGAYRITAEQAPPYADVAPFAKALIEANPDRCVWGTDWPHPHIEIPMPNDGDLLDMFMSWVPDESIRHKIFVDNPAKLYGF